MFEFCNYMLPHRFAARYAPGSVYCFVLLVYICCTQYVICNDLAMNVTNATNVCACIQLTATGGDQPTSFKSTFV